MWLIGLIRYRHMITKQAIGDFILRHQLPDKFHRLINEHYDFLVHWLVQKRQKGQVLLLGISGAQGTGKSTLADFLQLMLEENESWHVALLSIDDFYYTKAERKQLSEETHPLLLTRGVPGTHDIQSLRGCIEQLRNLGPDNKLSLPQFSKAQDDRGAVETWPVITGPIDLIILEGWCVGSTPQEPDTLLQPINKLERDLDPTGKWRNFVNRQLQDEYAVVFAELDALFFLQTPNFETAFRWRLEQEEKLASRSPDNSTGIMDRAQIAYFMEHYERLTRANLISLPGIADIVLELDENHDCVRKMNTFPPNNRPD